MGPLPPAPPRRRHPWRWTILGAITVAGALIGAGAAAPASGHHAAPAASSAPAAAPSPSWTPSSPPPPDPQPDGTYEYSCDQDLGADIYSPTYLTGEVDLNNTGNVGLIDRVTFRWHQEAYPDIVMRKTVRLKAGHARVVRFRYYAGTFDTATAPLDRNTSWEDSHAGQGCHARVTYTSTFGPVEG